MIAAVSGHAKGVKTVQMVLMDGDVTKYYYETAQKSYQQYIEEVRGDRRDEAVASSDIGHKYLIDMPEI